VRAEAASIVALAGELDLHGARRRQLVGEVALGNAGDGVDAPRDGKRLDDRLLGIRCGMRRLLASARASGIAPVDLDQARPEFVR